MFWWLSLPPLSSIPLCFFLSQLCSYYDQLVAMENKLPIAEGQVICCSCIHKELWAFTSKCMWMMTSLSVGITWLLIDTKPTVPILTRSNWCTPSLRRLSPDQRKASLDGCLFQRWSFWWEERSRYASSHSPYSLYIQKPSFFNLVLSFLKPLPPSPLSLFPHSTSV